MQENEIQVEAEATETTETKLEQEIVNEEQLVADDDDEDDGGKDEVSPSPALEIEGVVRGEPDNGLVQSEGGNFLAEADDTEVIIHTFNILNYYFYLRASIISFIRKYVFV